MSTVSDAKLESERKGEAGRDVSVRQANVCAVYQEDVVTSPPPALAGPLLT